MWFYETLYPDIKLGIRGKLIYKKRTPYQDLRIYDTDYFGKILTLDGAVQTTEKDEFIYHEMLTHPLVLSHPKPEKVLVIGAGDGGVLREILKHDIVKQAYLVEIDNEVILLSQRLLPSISKGAFTKDKRVKIIIADGAKFIRQTKEKFDLVIVDSPDPIGVAKVLFSEKFYKNIFSILKDKGMMIRQTGSTILQAQEIKQNYKIIKKVFPFVSVQLAAIPTYIGGFFSFIIASKKINPDNISYKQIRNKYKKLKLETKYYNPEIHFASKRLPNYIRRNIE
jgi:spermidine synthase